MCIVYMYVCIVVYSQGYGNPATPGNPSTPSHFVQSPQVDNTSQYGTQYGARFVVCDHCIHILHTICIYINCAVVCDMV